LTAQAGTGYTFTGWGGACSGTATCSVTMSAAKSVSAFFAPMVAGACAQSSSSVVFAATPPSISQIYNFQNYGQYNVSFDDWGPDPGTFTQWINSAACWGVSTTTSSERNGITSYSNVSRGWSDNGTMLAKLSTGGTYPANPNWTTLSGMGIQVSALTKAHVKWSMVVPTTPNTNDTVSRWDALIDIYFHTAAEGAPNPPSSAWLPQVDLQIMQMLMDAPLAGQTPNSSGYYALTLASKNGFTKTISGVTYVGAIDLAVFNQPGGHTITLMPTPTMFSAPATGLLWGQPSMMHDVGGIIAWLSQSNPTDDSGNPLKTATGTVVTTPLIPSSLYLDAINAGFEIDFGTAPNDNHWTTTNFWVAVQNEPDGP